MSAVFSTSGWTPEIGLGAVRRWIGDSESWVHHLVATAHEHPEIVAIVAMGSAVRERGHKRSDVDLLVIYGKKRPSLTPPVEVDIRYQSAEKLEQLVASGHEIVSWALKLGLPIYDPSRFWESFRSKWISNVKLPPARDAQIRAERLLKIANEMLVAGDEHAASDLVLAVLTQLVRVELIDAGVFPASRPELPQQLREIQPADVLAELLEDAMFADVSARELIERLARRNASASETR